MSPFARSTERWPRAPQTAPAWPTCRCALAIATLDNTHGTHRASAVNSLQLPLGDDREALARSLWLATNTGYGNALDSYLRVKTEAQVRAKEEDNSPDFSQQSPQTHIGAVAPPIVIDRAAWEQRVRELSRSLPRLP